MNQSDYKTFIDAWTTANEVMPGGKVLSTPAMQLVIEALNEYPLDTLLAAIKKHVQTARFAPVPNDIIELIASHSGSKHLSADEAWVIALNSFDEFETVVWTREIAEARSIACSIYLSGDTIAARMAFKEAYNRIVKTAGEPKWFVNVGFDAARRADAVKEAILLKRLPANYVDHYPQRLEANVKPDVTVAGLIEHAHKKTGKVSPLAALGVIKNILNEAVDLAEVEFQQRREKRLDFEARKQDQVAKVERKMAELH
jgi:hypothetical protein